MVKLPRYTLLAAAIAVAGFTANPAFADSAKEQQLEARVTELEKQLQAVLAELKAQKAAPPAQAQTAQAPAPKAGGPAPIQTTTITPGSPPNTKFTVGGFIKLDTLASKYDKGDVAETSAGRDFYLPSTIPVGPSGTQTENAKYDMHAKFSRVWLAADSLLDNGSKVGAKVEFDFFGGALGNERSTNTYGLTLRHAYAYYNGWLAGQTWSNFMDVNALPESVDFVGPTDGTVFVRQPQIRYTNGGWSFSVENPETTVTPFHGGAQIVTGDNSLPDLTGKYTWTQPWGYLAFAGLARELKDQTTGVGAINESKGALSGSFSGKVNFGEHNATSVSWAITGGEGFGRYVAFNFANDAVRTAAGSAAKLDAISGYAGFAAFRHVFSPEWRLILMASDEHYDNSIATSGGSANKSSYSYAADVFYSPVPKFDAGLEFRHANREIESGQDGTLNRVHLVMKYTF
jgi:hypothetical protein